MNMSRLFAWTIVAAFMALPSADADEPTWSEQKQNHWAWKTPTRPQAPAVRDSAWIRSPIDRFVLARLEAAGLKPAERASREQLIRRATFDLIGLPPTPREIDAFVSDRAANAWEKVIDRLLASPHYGERWGRHWLDLARFAESNGYEFDEPRPNAWRYREYVIAAFNADKPYDRFIKEQLAGDELWPDDPQAVIATGFNLLGPDMTDASSQAQRRQNTLDDMTDTTGLAFLGLTVGCARCHHHKFEPISQGDYFRLQAFFTPADFRRDLPVADRIQRAAHQRTLLAYHALTRAIRTRLDAMEKPYREKAYQARLAKLSDEDRLAHETPDAKRTPAQKNRVVNTARRLVITPKEITAAMSKEHRRLHDKILAELKKYDRHRPAALPTALALQETGKEVKTFILRRGELSNKGEEVQPSWPAILSPGRKPVTASIKSPSPGASGRRTALANWIARHDHPLTARVFVNRLWQHHFGRGIVATPSDFGVRGTAPTHRDLLDWLACEFTSPSSPERKLGDSGLKDRTLARGAGWTIKRMHRLMLLSATYQQATKAPLATLRMDPNNQLLGRMNRLRLEGEIIRDSLLAVSGRLNRKVGGPSVFPPLPADFKPGAKTWKPSIDPADHTRRSVYIFTQRNLRFPFLESFDPPDSNQSCPKRERSTTAPQALALLNSSDVLIAAKALAKRVEKEANAAGERITLAYRLTLGRTPSDAERRLAREFLRESQLSEFCRALFNVNEFVYLD
jgi:hypothetical protein